MRHTAQFDPRLWLERQKFQLYRLRLLQQAEISYDRIENYWRRTDQQKRIRRHEDFWRQRTAVFNELIAADFERRGGQALLAAANITNRGLYPNFRTAPTMEDELQRLVGFKPPKRKTGPKTDPRYIQGKQLLAAGRPLGEVTQQLDPEGYRRNPEQAKETMRKGTGRIKK